MEIDVEPQSTRMRALARAPAQTDTSFVCTHTFIQQFDLIACILDFWIYCSNCEMKWKICKLNYHNPIPHLRIQICILCYIESILLIRLQFRRFLPLPDARFVCLSVFLSIFAFFFPLWEFDLHAQFHRSHFFCVQILLFCCCFLFHCIVTLVYHKN